MLPPFLQPEKTPAAGELYGVLAEFDTPGELIAAAAKVRDAGYKKWDCYTPFPVHGLDKAMGVKMTILPWIVFLVGMGGLCGGLLLQWWANDYHWPWIVSGKPFFSLPANIPITFETTILASVFAAFFGMWTLNKLPQVWHPFFRKPLFQKVTDDGLFIGIEAADAQFSAEATKDLLHNAGALVTEDCHIDSDPAKKQMPKAILGFIIVTTVLALVPIAIIANARASHSTEPHFHLVPDMDFQPKVKTQSANKLFPQARAMRVGVSGTVARGELRADDHFFRGISQDQWAKQFPQSVSLDAELMELGNHKYDIYCQPCHGLDGRGNGIVAEVANGLGSDVSGWAPPANLVEARIVTQPHGQLFNTISNGKGVMQGYAAQMSAEERWAVILYLRALQRSQNASASDIPQGTVPK